MRTLDEPITLNNGLTFLPLSRHPNGTLIGEFYLAGQRIGPGHLTPTHETSDE